MCSLHPTGTLMTVLFRTGTLMTVSRQAGPRQQTSAAHLGRRALPGHGSTARGARGRSGRLESRDAADVDDAPATATPNPTAVLTRLDDERSRIAGTHPLRSVGETASRAWNQRASSRHGNRPGLCHRLDDGGRVLRLAHQAAAAVVPRNLRHGAAHVHVDNVGAH